MGCEGGRCYCEDFTAVFSHSVQQFVPVWYPGLAGPSGEAIGFCDALLALQADVQPSLIFSRLLFALKSHFP